MTIACMRKDVPAFHYMIGVTGGQTIRCAPYKTFATQALSDVAVKALKGRKACLLANHGQIAVGGNLKQALSMALEVETLCEVYWRIPIRRRAVRAERPRNAGSSRAKFNKGYGSGKAFVSESQS